MKEENLNEIESILKAAQAVIITESNVHLLGRTKMHLDRRLNLNPDLSGATCPIIDLSAIDEWADHEVREIIRRHVLPFAVHDVNGMCAELEKLGAVVTNRPLDLGSVALFASVQEKEERSLA